MHCGLPTHVPAEVRETRLELERKNNGRTASVCPECCSGDLTGRVAVQTEEEDSGAGGRLSAAPPSLHRCSQHKTIVSFAGLVPSFGHVLSTGNIC